MLRGLLTLTWLEIKIFVREPLGLIGTVGMPGARVHLSRAAVPGGAAASGYRACRAIVDGRSADLASPC